MFLRHMILLRIAVSIFSLIEILSAIFLSLYIHIRVYMLLNIYYNQSCMLFLGVNTVYHLAIAHVANNPICWIAFMAESKVQFYAFTSICYT